MKTIITTLNAKYIHTSLALRLIYVANKDRFDISFREFTTKEAIDSVVTGLLETNSDCIGIGVYIWNVTRVREVVFRLKQLRPDIILVLGGPEVSYEPEYFLENWNVDYVVSGEGEFVFGELLFALENNLPVLAGGVSSPGNISPVIAKADTDRLALLPSPYQLEEDKDMLKQKLVYFETSRGCPYQCAYCLSSLEQGVRYFPEDYLWENLDYLISSGVKQIKFLDRTFNLNKKHTNQIFDFLIRHYRPDLVCQFEIYADILDENMIDRINRLLPEHFFRFEIGIQSTYEPSNLAVNRRQDFALLDRNISLLIRGGKVDLHLDLIAGLPYETMDRFIQSFNDVFAWGAKEVQLGFLKLLRGTKLRKYAADYGYRYNADAPYEVICNDDISNEELRRIHAVEHSLEQYWNSGRFSATMREIFNVFYKGRYFEFFDELALFYRENGYKDFGYQLEDLFQCLNEFLESKGIDLFSRLREDYYHNFRRRPNCVFWKNGIEKKERKRIMEQIAGDSEFLMENQVTPYSIRKQTVVDYTDKNAVSLTIFLEEGIRVLNYTLPS